MIVHVQIGNEDIQTTFNHPFYVVGKGFVRAGKLEVGDEILTSEGQKISIEKIEIEVLAEPVYVYNFTVEDFHTYFVSELGVLVHNTCLVSKGGSDSVPKSLLKGKANTRVYYGIKDGKKDIELRLNDEKRRLVNIGDTIIFTNIDTKDEIEVIVTNLYKYDTFEELFNAFDHKRFGMSDNDSSITMDDFYSKEEQEKYGVLGIEIKLIK